MGISKGISVSSMFEIDKRAQDEYGIPQIVLMENAGRAAFEVILNDQSNIKNERIAVLCGKGNNGGDGFVLARYLAEETPKKIVVFAPDPDDIKKGPANINFDIICRMGLKIRPLYAFCDDSDVFSIAVDSIFGIGFNGKMGKDFVPVVQKLNSSGYKVYAVDIPSGLDATSGKASGYCVRAAKTVTFGLPKQGFFLEDGPLVCGDIIVKNIGFPGALLSEYQ
ncbi:MAG: NAD(P)H-hydrate epimerase [Candidatus Omnitrophota bacterium]